MFDLIPQAWSYVKKTWSLEDIKRRCTCGASYRDKKKRKRERQARKKGRR